MARCRLIAVEEEGGEVMVKIDSPISKNMRTTLRAEDIKRELPHSTGLSVGSVVALLKAKIGKTIEISNFNSPEKVRKGERKMKLSLTLKDGENWRFLAFTEEVIADERITGFPKKNGETTIDLEVSESLQGHGKTIKKTEGVAFIKDMVALVKKHGADVKEYSLSDK